jgi:hypothetical protein
MLGWKAPEFIDVLTPAATNPLSLAAADIEGTDTFEDRKSKLLGHLQSPVPIPIHIVGEGEFDFVLSDQGLELFVPGEPADIRDLVRYFTFRGTGRRPIGIPYYLGPSGPATPRLAYAKPTAMSTDSPTGPGQILMSRPAVEAEIVSVLALNPAMQACVEEVLHCLDAKSGPGPTQVGVEDSPIVREYAELSQRIARALRVGDPVLEADRRRLADLRVLRRRPERLATQRQVYVTQEPPAVAMSAEEYACLMKPLRCWQIAGSVYRGIMTELPRVVATMWLEELDAVPVAANGNSYQSHFSRGGNGNDDSGIRKVFRERLETSLPDARHMEFRTYTTAPGDRPAWTDRDVMITNQGFFFPRVDPLDVADNDPVVTEARSQAKVLDIYNEIMKGRAGNPVFTDSIYCL